jgi:hypothetical protein
MYICIDQLMMTPSSLFFSLYPIFSTCGNKFVRDDLNDDDDDDESDWQINFHQFILSRKLLVG